MIIIKGAYPTRVGILSIYRKEIGFIFDNMAFFQMLKDNDWDIDTDIDPVKYCNEFIYAAAVTYCKERYRKPNFTKKGLELFVKNLPVMDQKYLSDEIKLFMSGYNKKKAKTKTKPQMKRK